MKERSGIDMLNELIKEIKIMRKEIRVLDQNIKKIANSAKISELAEKVINTPLSEWTKIASNSKRPAVKVEAVDMSKGKSEVKLDKKKMRFNFESMDASKTNQINPDKRARSAPQSCMCSGKMVAEYKGKSVPLPGLDVSIFDDKDNLIKKTKTNRAGQWMSKLPPGNYIANIEGKFSGQDLYPINLTFVVKPGVTKLEVK